MDVVHIDDYQGHGHPDNGSRSAVIALGGGGARGIAHLGVMQAVNESNCHVQRIVGVSIGAFVGALCAVEPDIKKVQANAMRMLHSETFRKRQAALFGNATTTSRLFGWVDRTRRYVALRCRVGMALIGQALLPSADIEMIVSSLLPDIDISETTIPLSIVAADLHSGQRVVLENGSLRQAVLGSMAIPGVFAPVQWNDMLLSDIGVVDAMPTIVATAYARDLTIGVDVGIERSVVREFKSAIGIMKRVEGIGEGLIRRQAIAAADLVIRPRVGSISRFDFGCPDELIAEGYAAAHHELAKLDRRTVA